ncbi:MAG: dihydropteroate synthase, partial [Pseudomonadota bacterium]
MKQFKISPSACLMAIINITPDSFSQDGVLAGSEKNFIDRIVQKGREAVNNGVKIIDLGAESSRPGAIPVDAKTQINRLLPAIKALKQLKQCPTICIDTTLAEVAQKALEQGATMINDISALSDPKMANIVSEAKAKIILMHNQAEWGNFYSINHPSKQNLGNSYHAVNYDHVITEVLKDLLKSTKKALNAGIKKNNIILDPGIGFGKSVEDNLKLLAHIDTFKK